MAELKETVSAYLMEHEGVTSYVYLDHYGNLTYGIGHNVGSITKDETLKKMKAMALYRDGEKPGSSEALKESDIEKSYYDMRSFYDTNKKYNEQSKKDVLNYKHSYYQNTYKIKVSEDLVKEEFNRNVDTAVSDAKKVFSNFGNLPQSAQSALTQLSFAMGYPNLKKFATVDTDFKALIEANKMKEAALLIDKVKAWNGKRKEDVKALLTKNLAAPLPPSTPTPAPKSTPTPTTTPKQKKLPGLNNFFNKKLKR